MSIIRPNTEGMERSRTARGGSSFRGNDDVARFLDGQPVEVSVAIARALGMDVDKYMQPSDSRPNPLNPGHLKMVLSNRFRQFIKTWDNPKNGDGNRTSSGLEQFQSIAKEHLVKPVADPEEPEAK
jgi:hypothetical protein